MTEAPLTVADAASALRDGTWTSRALVEKFLQRADQLDPLLGTFVYRIDREVVMEAAALADLELQSGRDRGPLHGIPLGVKDNLTTADAPTTAQSRLLLPGPERLRFDAAAVAGLRGQGGILLGKTSTQEFAKGRPDVGGPFPIPRNPWHVEYWTSGSSSGTANGVAAGLVLGGLGSDTAGSIRLPAAFCGVTGLKPTYGLVSTYGCLPLASTLDHVGPIARSARDCAILLDAIAGYDSRDVNSKVLPAPQAARTLDEGVAGLRIGVDRVNHLNFAGLTDSSRELFEDALQVLEKAGADLIEIDIPFFAELSEAVVLVSLVEAFVYHQPWLRERPELYSDDTRRSMLLGGAYLASDYARALQVIKVGRRAVQEAMVGVDALISPSTPGPPDRLDLLAAADRMTPAHYVMAWNGTGFPALTVPIGFDRSGFPAGMQVVAQEARDDLVLRVGHAYQMFTEWHLQVPPAPAAVTAR